MLIKKLNWGITWIKDEKDQQRKPSSLSVSMWVCPSHARTTAESGSWGRWALSKHYSRRTNTNTKRRRRTRTKSLNVKRPKNSRNLAPTQSITEAAMADVAPPGVERRDKSTESPAKYAGNEDGERSDEDHRGKRGKNSHWAFSQDHSI